MLRELDFTKESVSESVFGLKEMFLEDARDRGREILKEVLEAGLTWEFGEYKEAGRYERREGRKDYRNG